MVNKKGVLRIVESTVAILIIFGVLLVLATRADEGEIEDLSNRIGPLLREIASDNVLRVKILTGDSSAISDIEGIVEDRINNPSINQRAVICDPLEFCGLESYPDVSDGNIYSDERIITTTLSSLGDLDPKKVKIFLWRK